MSAETNKAFVQRFYQEIWNEGRLDAIEEYFATDFVDNNPAAPGLPPGAAGARATFATFRAAFPDIHFHVDTIVAEGDQVASRWTAHGTHRGELMGMPPTGKSATVTGIDIMRIAGGKVVERWGNFDQMAMMQQLGVMGSA